MNVMTVERPGMLSTLQDIGRHGHQQYGVSVNGPMDEWSHRLANALVGNDEDAAVLECTLTGPRVAFAENTLVALCGARMRITANGQPIAQDTAVLLRRGTVLDVGERLHGARLYLAVRGGFAAEPVLGSRSTNIRAGFGGHDGRALKRGDRVLVGRAARDLPVLRIEKLMVQSGMPVLTAEKVAVAATTYTTEHTEHAQAIRFIPGPHWPAFTRAAQDQLSTLSYTVTQQSDRMGARLQGEALKLHTPLELISEATAFGTIQVPPDGQPIVLMADRQSAGGYPKIAYVASADLPLLAQAMPGDALRFTAVRQADAELAWRDTEDRLRDIRQAAARILQPACAAPPTNTNEHPLEQRQQHPHRQQQNQE
ncbi:biotin-dependent carboxyltransferase family protein [Bordetella sp. LUAb4]|uniref:5-oxoprolinase subunit C family protein n=1 Tax=Bordetella sp. LUAb4 TaxID=2843195 RepID=UPI001E5A215D|nr:biotin-dependent carboxyltransferase family protein [Bordetella sp. LUAb4]